MMLVRQELTSTIALEGIRWAPATTAYATRTQAPAASDLRWPSSARWWRAIERRSAEGRTYRRPTDRRVQAATPAGTSAEQPRAKRASLHMNTDRQGPSARVHDCWHDIGFIGPMHQDQPLDRASGWQRSLGPPANVGGRQAARRLARHPTDPEIAAARERRETPDRMGVVVAFDQPLLREAIRALLEAERDLRIIGEYGDGREVVQAVKRLAPDVLVVSLMLPRLSGLEVTRHIREHMPTTRVVIVSMYASELYAANGLRHGAVGYVATAARGKHLVKAVRAARSGRRYLSPPLTARGVDAHLKRTPATAVDPYNILTTREREVLHLAADGFSNPRVAATLGISRRTAETHRAHLMRKLRLRTQTELVRYTIERPT